MVKWRFNLKLKMVLFVILLLILGCSKTPQTIVQFSGDYPTENIRGIWAFCVENFKMRSPYTPPFLVAQMCDCYLDEMRRSHPAGDINNLSDNETKAMGQKLVRVCNVKQTPKII
jgi:hypothetical protein